MNCRAGCGACCVIPSINQPIPGHPDGKPAGVRCANLTDEGLCGIYDTRPAVCRGFRADPAYCGDSDSEAYFLLTKLSAVAG